MRGRDLAVSVLDGEPLPVIEAVAADEEFYDFEARYEIGRTTFTCPAALPDGVGERARPVSDRSAAQARSARARRL